MTKLLNIATGLQRFPQDLGHGQAGIPLLVERLDQSKEAYYLIPWEAEGKVVIIVQLDGRTGELQSIGEQRNTEPLPNIAEALKQVRATRTWIDNALSRWVWCPCQESHSSLMPFWELTSPRGDVLYIRADGQVFEVLTPAGQGG